MEEGESGEKGCKGAKVQRSKGARERGSKGGREGASEEGSEAGAGKRRRQKLAYLARALTLKLAVFPSCDFDSRTHS